MLLPDFWMNSSHSLPGEASVSYWSFSTPSAGRWLRPAFTEDITVALTLWYSLNALQTCNGRVNRDLHTLNRAPFKEIFAWWVKTLSLLYCLRKQSEKMHKAHVVNLTTEGESAALRLAESFCRTVGAPRNFIFFLQKQTQHSGTTGLL